MSLGPLTAQRPVTRGWWIAGGVLGCAALAVAVSFAETSVDEPRVLNPVAPQPLPELEWAGLGVDGFWVPIFYVVTWAVMGLMAAIFIRHWRATRHVHPGLPVFVALGLGVLMDPFFNWAMYVPYHPGLLHWPVDWTLFDLAPTVEPLWIVMGAYQVFFLGPALGAFALHRRFIAGRAKDGSFTRRHPLLSLFLFGTAVGALADILMEVWMINIAIYEYSQIAGPSLHWGYARLAVFEIIWIGLIIGLITVMLHRDDTGASTSARLARSVPLFRRLRLGEWGIAFVAILAAFVLYGAFFATLRVTGSATNVTERTWPWPAVKTYDPDGRMKAAGQPGPYFDGTWCTSSRCSSSDRRVSRNPEPFGGS